MEKIMRFPDQRIIAGEAAEWLIRLDSDTPPTRHDLRALGEWLHRSPAHREELERMAVLWARMNILTELAVPLGRPNAVATSPHRERSAELFRSSWRRSGLLAPLVVAALALVALLLTRGPEKDPLLATNELYATTVGQQKTTMLADGSEVILNTNSQIRVDYGDKYRKVQLLQGEALFTVAKNAERPFRVYAENDRIQAVGTAFSVHLSGEDVKITVSEGHVSLSAVKQSLSNATQSSASTPHRLEVTGSPTLEGGLVEPLGMLHAGQVATIHNSVPEAALEIITLSSPEELAQRLAWRDGILVFSGDRLEEVVNEISRYTTVSIEISDPAVRDMRIGGRFPVGETEAMLAVLENNFDLRVTHLGHNRVVLSAGNKECSPNWQRGGEPTGSSLCH